MVSASKFSSLMEHMLNFFTYVNVKQFKNVAEDYTKSGKNEDTARAVENNRILQNIMSSASDKLCLPKNYFLPKQSK